jgi:hypothetical protein
MTTRSTVKKTVIVKNDVFVWIQVASINMTTRSTVKKTVIVIDDLILEVKKQTHAAKVITVRLTVLAWHK